MLIYCHIWSKKKKKIYIHIKICIYIVEILYNTICNDILKISKFNIDCRIFESI